MFVPNYMVTMCESGWKTMGLVNMIKCYPVYFVIIPLIVLILAIITWFLIKRKR